MYAARLVAPGRFELDDVVRPAPGDGQVLVRMVASSVCGTDLHVVFGPFHPPSWPAEPGNPGHEGIGVVEQSRSSRFRAGDVVLTVPHQDRMTCFAEYHLAEDWALVEIPTQTDLHSAMMAQQLGTVVYAMKRFWPRPAGRSAVVVGAGSAGLFFLQVLKASGFETVVVSDPVRARRDTATALGADHVVDPSTTPTAEATGELTDGAGADLVIEAAGTESARRHAVAVARDQGRVGFFGYAEHPEVEAFPYAEAWRKSLEMVTSANTQLEPGVSSFREAVRMITTGELSVKHLMSAPRWPLDHIQDGFEAARDHRVNKVILDIDAV